MFSVKLKAFDSPKPYHETDYLSLGDVVGEKTWGKQQSSIYQQHLTPLNTNV